MATRGATMRSRNLETGELGKLVTGLKVFAKTTSTPVERRAGQCSEFPPSPPSVKSVGSVKHVWEVRFIRERTLSEIFGHSSFSFVNASAESAFLYFGSGSSEFLIRNLTPLRIRSSSDAVIAVTYCPKTWDQRVRIQHPSQAYYPVTAFSAGPGMRGHPSPLITGS
ncbi:hypothetical protein TREMEDRAFT_61153 [Tremella mesenterica DSM 1558]|uniref:uncharacterized protein n=1 Tax=Tremella mesenterica (strain ATCC 24925 / CBS 8224 / DSM 1558 / NBRC 9311 / NRRL Y-6157 / RJB 2259-6 / UBC 559-6) TaxID=578456 RepID=UPI0003F4A4D7|nr:uncharacterized protein TREMEDRAFT_61153 [Tremella mesenterica DSM 1558]EIW70645.1 hypothetical protein TREMEDRAFT_61153 [Tremella mesenterica DSM 1558]